MELSEILCDYLNGFGERPCDFLPETLGTACPTAGVFRKGEIRSKPYVDGSALVTVPFEVRLRIRAVSPREKLAALAHLSSLAAYVKAYPLEADGVDEVEAVGGGEKIAAYTDGEEEYGMKLCVKVRMA